MRKDKNDLSREFLGVFPPKTPFDNKHLKAYLQGATQFAYKKDDKGEPIYYLVKQRYFKKSEILRKTTINE